MKINIYAHTQQHIHAYWAEVGVLCNVTCNSMVAGRGCHDEQQRVTGLLPQRAISMNKWHQQGEDQQVSGTLLHRSTPKYQLQNCSFLRHAHTYLTQTNII